MKIQTVMFGMLAAGALLSSCKKDTSPGEVIELSSGAKAEKGSETKVNTFYGPQVHVGNGKARSFFRITHSGVPQELGIEMTEGAMSGLPEHYEAFVLPLHQKAAAATPFDHLVINWAEHGHPPLALFSESHFDFHFYTISLAERLAIPVFVPNGPHDVLPAPAFRPQGFIPLPGGEAKMGKHWADIIHPVIPGTFTHTMIYGSYNGKINFIEPMVTRAFLQSGTEVSMPFGQPAQFHETGTYYPTTYNISDDDKGKHYISLTNFVWR